MFVALVLFAASLADRPVKVDTKAASFAITFHSEKSAYRDLSAFVLPASTLQVGAEGPPGDYTISTKGGTLTSRGPHAWAWRAPLQPGAYTLRIVGPAKDAIALHAFVMVPAARVKHGILNGYPIGRYPAKPLNGNPIYRPPAGFIEVTKDNQDTRVSPHFELKQFLCKEDTTKEFPKYVALQERLPLKLEAILERVNTLGYHLDTLNIMSGYRTPFYNHAIGDVLFSMHQWGSAADIFVDKSGDGQMEDLNHDGQIDVSDAEYLFGLIERMLDEPEYGKFQGGMGFYPATAGHPPFVHVDVRGTKARWKG
jgi:hypothetical protein